MGRGRTLLVLPTRRATLGEWVGGMDLRRAAEQTDGAFKNEGKYIHSHVLEISSTAN